ncbi:hypothetical protein PHMEG_0006693 [Phytophthora megakarya]|uniref:Retrotransposon gag domain-containing protein n=1 Tax=Phytophthora megakarya TaxID=4795 RepID=A0A225WPQ8_9STRA|nr:hypothetical protein PHMEG_0006693 [Phytophthora megakarya]
MDQSATPKTFGGMLLFFAQQQVQFQTHLQEHLAAQNARFGTLETKPPDAQKSEPPLYHGSLNEDLELWFFATEQFYADYHRLMAEESVGFVTMVSCHLAPTPINWYRQFVAETNRAGTARTWENFKAALRTRFLPPDNEYALIEKLCKLTQMGPLHDYIGNFQNLLVQCQVPISPLELRFYFQQGLLPETSHHLKEHHPTTLDEAIALALRFDHSLLEGSGEAATADWVKMAPCHRCKKVGHIAPQNPTLGK